MAVLIDSYSESNADVYRLSISGRPIYQSFHNDNDCKLESVKLYQQKWNVVRLGTSVVKIYAHSGTFGTSSVPTGNALATSDYINNSDINSAALYTYNFSGVERITLNSNTNYCIVIENTVSSDILTYYDNSSPTHGGNSGIYTSPNWEVVAGDICFYVYRTDDIFPPTGALTLEGYSPSVTITVNKNITPNVGELTISGFAPTVVGGSGGGGEITLVNTSQGSNYTGAATSTPSVTAQSLTVGNFIVVCIRTYTGTPVVNSVTDTAGNTYYKAIGRTTVNTTVRTEIWYAKNVTGNASNTVTANMSGSVQYWGIVTIQYSGVDTTSPLDTTSYGDAATTTSITSNAFTTTQASEVIVAMLEHDSSVNQTWTAGTGYTIRKQDASTMVTVEDKTVTSIQTNITASGTLGVSRNLSITVATFKAASVSTSIKTILGLAKASVKTFNGLAIASVKTINGLA